VTFQVQVALEGVGDRLDPLPDRANGPVAERLVAAVRADQAHPQPGGDQVVELLPGKAAKGVLSITPHMAGDSPAGAERAAELAGKQLARWVGGEPLHNVVIQGSR